MNENMFRFIMIPLIIILISGISRFMRKKLVKPESVDGIQSPGNFDKLIMKLMVALTIFAFVFTILGVMMREMEMAIVFLVLSLILVGIVLILRNEHNMTYEENDDFFILKAKNKHYQVYYKNIVDWHPSVNEIKILDKTRPGQKFIRVNIAMIKPEKLLRKMVEMTFNGKFSHPDFIDPADPNRENEIVNFLIQNNYEYIVEDYV